MEVAEQKIFIGSDQIGLYIRGTARVEQFRDKVREREAEMVWACAEEWRGKRESSQRCF